MKKKMFYQNLTLCFLGWLVGWLVDHINNVTFVRQNSYPHVLSIYHHATRHHISFKENSSINYRYIVFQNMTNIKKELMENRISLSVEGTLRYITINAAMRISNLMIKSKSKGNRRERKKDKGTQ